MREAHMTVDMTFLDFRGRSFYCSASRSAAKQLNSAKEWKDNAN
jgi:hypothetical protein